MTTENEYTDLVGQSIRGLQRAISEVKTAGMMDLKPKATEALDQAFRTIVLLHEDTQVQAAQLERLAVNYNQLVDGADRRLRALEVSANAS